RPGASALARECCILLAARPAGAWRACRHAAEQPAAAAAATAAAAPTAETWQAGPDAAEHPTAALLAFAFLPPGERVQPGAFGLLLVVFVSATRGPDATRKVAPL